MAQRAFKRGQTQVMYRHLPESVFEHDDYGICRVTAVRQDRAQVNEEALFDALYDSISLWGEDFAAGFADPRDAHARKRYAVGTPQEVAFVPFPTLLECTRCGNVYRATDLESSRARPGLCPSQGCTGRLVQIRYVQAHNCGRMEELHFNPRRMRCKAHPNAPLRFHNPGRVALARWKCAECGADVQRLRMTPCRCSYSGSLGPDAPRHERFMKVFSVTDPALFLMHTTTFVNFPSDDERLLSTAEGAYALLLARDWGMLDEPVKSVLQRVTSSADAEEEAISEKLLERLRELSPDDPLVVEHEARRRESRGGGALARLKGFLGPIVPANDAPPPRKLVEHVAITDALSHITSSDVQTWMRERGDEGGAARIEQAVDFGRAELGIQDVTVVRDFPIALMSSGYTRVLRDPQRSILNAFPPDEAGKTPLYVLATETEGIQVRLSPRRVVAWLRSNGLVPGGDATTSIEHSWAELFGRVPELWTREAATATLASRAVVTLVHTMSHVLLRHVEWSGFAPSSIGEYLMPGSLSFVLYSNRYARNAIGGLTTLFEQRLLEWMIDVRQGAKDCIYDPICTDEGGSCVGCLHREYNCDLFNRSLSRASLYGGPTPTLADQPSLEFKTGYWQQR